MMEKAVMVEQEGAGPVLFWVDSEGSLGWIAGVGDGGLREIVAEMELPSFEWYRCSADGITVHAAAGNLSPARQTTRMNSFTFIRQHRHTVLQRRERVKRFGQILRGEVSAEGKG